MEVLLVDDGRYAGDVAQLLRRVHRHAVTHCTSPAEARLKLESQCFDVAIVDVLFLPQIDEFERHRRSTRVSVDTGPFLDSALAVLQAVRDLRPTLPAVIWSDGSENRVLHMIYAYQEYEVRAFYFKDTGGGASTLNEAIEVASRRQEHIAQKLYESGLRPVGFTIRETLFRDEKWACIWRALALGARSHTDIANAVRDRIGKYKRSTIGDMAQAADNMNAVSDFHGGDSLAFCITYAARNREFFLDSTVRQQFP